MPVHRYPADVKYECKTTISNAYNAVIGVLRMIAGCGVLLVLLNYSAAAHTLHVNVQDTHGIPVENASVAARVHSPLSAHTDTGGTVTFTGISDGYILIIAQHPQYGRTAPLYPFISSSTSCVITLPALNSLRFATYNLKGFDSWAPEQHHYLAKILWTVQPDIVSLQECPDSGLLFTDFTKSWLPAYTGCVSTAGWAIHNGILSRYPVQSTFKAGTSVMTRDLYGAFISAPVVPQLCMMSVHFKAGGYYSDGERRNEEATYVRNFCSNLYTSAKPFFLAGDCNDDPDFYRSPSRVHDIFADGNSFMTQLHAYDESGSDDTFFGESSYTRRYDYLYPANYLANYVISSRVFRSDTMNNRPLWLNATDSTNASDHFIVYTDILLVPEPTLFTAVLFLAFSCIHINRRI
jgi:endonuclease/exonuclease/phosphatase family metal-dependent hydrolase